ncbi:MAG TPA: molybdate ABC transporter substrate-binding protein [Burkholderiales bacterium]|nr:molybdate ABC transporter substrate-binding protein [Burkholderiales bacterium]
MTHIRTCGDALSIGLRMRQSGRRIIGVCIAAASIFFNVPALSSDIPTIAASADMSLALMEIAGGFSRQTNKKVNLTFGSSGALAQQIAGGAAFQLFLSADEASATSLYRSGKAIDEGTIYGVGRISLFAPTKKKGNIVLPNLAALKAALEEGKIDRLAISNPELCAYGRAAREALQEAGIWTLLGEKLVVVDDAAQAAEMALAAKVDAAILPLALVMSPIARSRGAFSVIDVKAHRSIRQRMILLSDAELTARAFYSYMQAPVAREVLRRYGYTFPLR